MDLSQLYMKALGEGKFPVAIAVGQMVRNLERNREPEEGQRYNIVFLVLNRKEDVNSFLSGVDMRDKWKDIRILDDHEIISIKGDFIEIDIDEGRSSPQAQLNELRCAVRDFLNGQGDLSTLAEKASLVQGNEGWVK